MNCLRAIPGQGLVVRGARTLSRDQDWKYLHVRRLASYLQASITQSTHWAVFEPNDEKLWASVRQSVTSFLTDQWRRGALVGKTAEEAFYVICDDSNNPADDTAEGRLVIDVGYAPARPGPQSSRRSGSPSRSLTSKVPSPLPQCTPAGPATP
ncbi:phage tail sheath C-terminal domain-containing protein [Streptomyces sp. NPDC060028]|uniref:phage tail sheath C-terminal domain-containing protein n=1 Tax=Streptomyces sp. NPDC060028 TaxID=3347041 RepID=UPI003673AE43